MGLPLKTSVARLVLIAMLLTGCVSQADPSTTSVGVTTPEVAATISESPTSTVALEPSTTTSAPTPSSTSPPVLSTTTTTTAITSTTSTVPIPPGNRAPTVEIISPVHLSSHTAVLDPETNHFGAAISLSAVVSDPVGDEVTVDWFSSDEGFLGTGGSIVATLSTGQFDAAQPQITARATDRWGVSTEASVQIIVWIPSDT